MKNLELGRNGFFDFDTFFEILLDIYISITVAITIFGNSIFKNHDFLFSADAYLSILTLLSQSKIFEITRLRFTFKKYKSLISISKFDKSSKYFEGILCLILNPAVPMLSNNTTFRLQFLIFYFNYFLISFNRLRLRNS